LVAKAFDVVHAVGDDNGVTIQGALDGRVKSCPSIFLGSRGSVDISVESKRVVVDVMEFQTLDTWL
jgi:hypothetical protein